MNLYILSESQTIEFGYLNPNISLEYQQCGFGVGFLTGDRPIDLSEKDEDENTATDASFHVRFGNPKKAYFTL
jgi:hypothetical protein